MGQFLFDVPECLRQVLPTSFAERAYICGIEGVPFESRIQATPSRITIRRGINDSGKLLIPVRVPNQGTMTLSTCSLRPETMPHALALEIARGCCFRVRNQSDVWERAGLRPTDTLKEHLQHGTSAFLDSAQRRSDAENGCAAAITAIEQLERAATELTENYASHAVAYRMQSEQRIGTLCGATLHPPGCGGDAAAGHYVDAFNSVAARMTWSEIENIHVVAGGGVTATTR
ncbi:MAG: glycoside hydrolase family 10, partial [Planctomycetota bacterium]